MEWAKCIARTLAALSHPNIAIVYDLEEDGERRALVMELVEGATLAERVTQGALPIDEAIHVALASVYLPFMRLQ